ncbi:MAG TPA: hypothetical protein VF950_05700 [Planctomycetota bacterium]
MERVAFLIESTGERIGCMLNPETLLVQRSAGVRPRRAGTGVLAGAGLSDQPLLYTGGGSTALTLELLFDVTLPGSSVPARDVRTLTGPLWNLAENAGPEAGFGRPPVARFVWGKTWNLPGVVADIAERLEAFGADGAPRRSWVRLRFLRTPEPRLPELPDPVPGADVPGAVPEDDDVPGADVPDEELRVHEVAGGAPPEGDGDDPGGQGLGDRIDILAARYLGSAALWRLLARLNDVDDPSALRPGQVLRVPGGAP